MNNPYAAPEVELNDQTVESQSFEEFSWKQLKKLRNTSSTITTLGALWCLPVILYSILLVTTLASGELDPISAVFFLAVIAFLSLCIYSAWSRPSWGRGLCMVPCIFGLLGFPLGTAIGILGLVALSSAAPLFGSGKIDRKDLNAEYKHRKRNKIFD